MLSHWTKCLSKYSSQKFLPAVVACRSAKSQLDKEKIVRTMSDQSRPDGSLSKCLVSVCQHTCKENKEDNFNVFKSLIKDSAKAGCKIAFLPECFDFIGESRAYILQNSEPINGNLICKYQELAKELDVWLFLGGLHEKTQNGEDGKVSNAHIVINNVGTIVSIYRKLHLFNLDVPGTRLVESEYCVGGHKVNEPVQTPAGKVGLGICYDLRFAEFAISLAKAGANILTYPASFTVKTGLAHWEALLRARAIETQCYVVAAAQTGIHNPKRSSYGHSMIVDPWGSVIAQVGDRTGFAIGEIDFDYLKDIRARLPIWTDRKPECYGNVWPAIDNEIESRDSQEFVFGQTTVKASQVFYQTRHAYAFVNHRPILAGHVLVASLRKVAKFTDLNAEEVSDLFQCVQKVEKVLEKVYQTDSTTIALQDGLDAGQSICHVHVHLIPRKPTDFAGKVDQVYAELQTHDKKNTPIRSEQDMREQSLHLKTFF